MSVQLCVFLHESVMPTCEQWQCAVRDAGHDLTFGSFSPREHERFVPMQLAGETCGFEYSFDQIEPSEVEDVADMVGDRSYVAIFTCHSSMLDYRAAEIAAATLTELCSGVYFDPQSGSHAEGKDVHALLSSERSAEMERKLAEADRKWAKVTERRCPKCNARCPEYRGSCWVCGYAIGKCSA